MCPADRIYSRLCAPCARFPQEAHLFLLGTFRNLFRDLGYPCCDKQKDYLDLMGYIFKARARDGILCPIWSDQFTEHLALQSAFGMFLTQHSKTDICMVDSDKRKSEKYCSNEALNCC